MTRQLPTTIVTTSYAYTAHLHRSVAVGSLARYLTQVEANVRAGTLEIAHVLPLDMRVEAINMQRGDRLLIANDPIKTSALALPPRAGEQILHLEAGALSIQIPRKQTITIGWSNSQSKVPDIDLRDFVGSEQLQSISQDCMHIYLEKDGWYARRTGDTRIVIDELELLHAPVPLNQSQRIRLYSAHHKHNRAFPIVELHLSIQTLEAKESIAPMPSGSMPIAVHPGVESTTHLLRASERLTLRQIVAALAQKENLALGNASVYLARILPPDISLHRVVNEESFLHVPLETRYARRMLRLQDISHTGQVYNIRSGRIDTKLSMGWRMVAESAKSEPDLDLYPSLTVPPPYLPNASETKAYLNYSAFAETWSLNIEDSGQVGVFVNNIHVGRLPVRISAGDFISFGLNMNSPLVRLQADIVVE